MEKKVEEAVQTVLQFIGEDLDREGLVETPSRVVRSYKHLFGGYSIDISSLFKTFEAINDSYDEIIVLKNIEFYSMCEHHMLPFFGQAHVAYIPDKKVIGVSKLARIVDAFARRLQIQERMGDQITSAIMSNLKAKGAVCVIEASHLCMRMRGVEKQNSIMMTSSLKGVFLKDPSSRSEVFSLLKH
jgi:GTP cyclohydrolase I